MQKEISESILPGAASALGQQKQLELDIESTKRLYVEAVHKCSAQEKRILEMMKPLEAEQAHTKEELSKVYYWFLVSFLLVSFAN